MWKPKMPEIFTVHENDTDVMRLMKLNMRRMAGMAGIAVITAGALIFAMSAAWYSNIVHADSLTFKAQSWDFDFEGNVTIGGEDGTAVAAVPGDTGLIPMYLENAGTTPIKISVTTDKILLTDAENGDPIKKRVFFYVEDQKTANGETVPKSYVNLFESYEYVVLEGQNLTLKESYQSAPALMWEWVYELQGYYVMGSVSSEEGAETVIEEYLRPIQYDSSKAVFDEHGMLIAVNGKSLQEFLAELTAADGYEGSLAVAEGEAPVSPVKGYYPIDVDESGRGVWLYLCQKGEIDAANVYDTELGKKALEHPDSTAFTVRICLSGQNYTENIIPINSGEELALAIQTEGAYRLILNGDVAVEETITVSAGREVVLDLNHSTLHLASEENGFIVEPGGSLHVVNGEVTAQADAADVPSKLFYTKGGDISLTNVTVEEAETLLRIEDDAAEGYDSNVRITNCNIATSDVSIFVRGNGLDSAQKTAVVIENSTISSDYLAVSGAGSASGPGYWGTNIYISGSTLSGKWGAIYHPQQKSTMKILNSTLTGYTAVAIKGGNVDIENSQINGTGDYANAAFADSGFTDTGDGVYVETNYGYDIAVHISGVNTTINSLHANAIRMHESDAAHAVITVTGGTYSSDVSGFLPAAGTHECVTTIEGKQYQVYEKAATTVEEE